MTITFTEAVSGFTLADLSSESGTLSELVQSTSNPLVWTAKLTPSVSVEDSSNVIKLGTGYTDLAGNVGGEATSESYAVETKAPGAVVTLASTITPRAGRYR